MEREKLLSQKEIDALLSALPQAGAELPQTDRFVGTARAYDFRSPDKFSKEQIRTLQMIHENFSRRFSSSLSAYLRAAVQVSCVHVEQGSFADFIQNIPSPSLITVLSIAPLPGRILMATDTTTATVAVDRLLGGFGQPADDDHEITDLEQSLMAGVIDYLVEALAEAWRNVIDLEIVVEETALNAEFVQVALPSDAAVFLGFEVRINEITGVLSICIPYAVLKPIVSQLSPHAWVAGEARGTGVFRDSLLKHLQKVNVNLSVLLGDVSVDFEELLSLQTGDVLVLNSILGRPLPVLIGETTKYWGQPGLSANHVAIQILRVMEDVSNG